ncbi:MAG: sigma 54-interacting transcriptional regulator [Nitrospinae bacterium]|nr:sigma 54-interacting transcriptional regulator [Nitrospinota bacterium]
MNSDLSTMALNAVFRASQCLAKPGEPNETLGDLLAILDETLGYTRGFVAVLERDSGDLELAAAHGIPQDKWKGVRFRKGEGITGLILETEAPLAAPRLGSDPRFLNRLGLFEPDSAMVGVPIILSDVVIGAFCVSMSVSERYRLDDHITIVSMFANLAGSVVTQLVRRGAYSAAGRGTSESPKPSSGGIARPKDMVGVSKAMAFVFEAISHAAARTAPTLIRGEPGTGKELAARAIHYASPRASAPFVVINCAATPGALLEAELFGAGRDRPGKLAQAHGGTLFLDEVAETPPAFQSGLMRFLLEGSYERRDGALRENMDVRMITSTSADLEKAVARRKFREDLYYKLNVLQIFIPPLRERKEDIPPLVDHILDRLGRECGERLSITPDAMDILSGCDWRGNTRELENCVSRCAAHCAVNTITREDIPCHYGQCASRLARPGARWEGDAVSGAGPLTDERERIIAALKKTGWVQAKAARLLKMTPRQIGYRITKLKIDMESF